MKIGMNFLTVKKEGIFILMLKLKVDFSLRRYQKSQKGTLKKTLKSTIIITQQVNVLLN